MPPYGVMFHHFYDDKHPKGQGAISSEDLEDLIRFLGRDRILPAKEWLRRALNGDLDDDNICLTFDDALRCQYDVALPVLKEFDLTAFWFVYSSIFEGKIEPLEIYRYFRTTEFVSIDEFYEEFFSVAREAYPEPYYAKMEGFDPDLYLASYPFYSRNDRIFRYLRDVVLSSAAYNQIMERMMRKYRFDPSKAAEMLWMNNQHLRALDEGGHVVGLHSYSHPTVLANLAQTDQKEEYERNLGHLVRVLGSRPITMSHPCNSYSSTTLQVLSNFGIKVGFCATMDDLVDRSHLEYPRQDHANLMKEMRE